MTKKVSPGRNPYRDYGLKYWDAIHTWVTDYLDVSWCGLLSFFGLEVSWCRHAKHDTQLDNESLTS